MTIIERLGDVLIDMLNSMVCPAWILDADGIVLYQNGLHTETFGNLIDMPSKIVYSDGMRSESDVARLFPRQSTKREVIIADIIFSIQSTKVFDYTGDECTVEIFDDISESKRLQRDLLNSYTRLKDESVFAQNIQTSILPEERTHWGTFDLHYSYLPTEELGGDIFDIMRINKHEFIFYIADVSGHGIQASLLTIFIREKVRGNVALAEEGIDVLLDEVLCGFQDLEIYDAMYVGMFMCKYNRITGDLTAANAGHNCYPLIIKKDGDVQELPLIGMPISIITEPASFIENMYTLGKGDRILLFTDGIIEEYSRAKKKSFGNDGVKQVIKANLALNSPELIDKLLKESEKYLLFKAKDDRTIMMLDIIDDFLSEIPD